MLVTADCHIDPGQIDLSKAKHLWGGVGSLDEAIGFEMGA